MNFNYYRQPDFNNFTSSKQSRRRTVFLILSLFLAGYAAFRLGFAYNTIEINNGGEPSFWRRLTGILALNPAEPADKNYIMPEKEENRFDVLLLGIRGGDDPEAKDAGPLLADTIMLLSFNKENKKTSVISVPRDLYVKIDGSKKDKINTAYEYGIYRNKGLNFTKELLSKITGVYVDKALVIEFSSFEKIIDELGGIDLTLTKPFEEPSQWGYAFSLPAGQNHLNGRDALYYARSRYSSNDFDRSRRQQQVIFAVKDKLSNLNFWADPLKTISLLAAIRNNIATDINIWNTKELLDLAKEIGGTGKIAKEVISTENLLYENRENEAYILLPKGDNFDGIKQLFQDVINNDANPAPVLSPKS